jgi:hypothetical protein
VCASGYTSGGAERVSDRVPGRRVTVSPSAAGMSVPVAPDSVFRIFRDGRGKTGLGVFGRLTAGIARGVPAAGRVLPAGEVHSGTKVPIDSGFGKNGDVMLSCPGAWTGEDPATTATSAITPISRRQQAVFIRHSADYILCQYINDRMGTKCAHPRSLTSILQPKRAAAREKKKFTGSSRSAIPVVRSRGGAGIVYRVPPLCRRCGSLPRKRYGNIEVAISPITSTGRALSRRRYETRSPF